MTKLSVQSRWSRSMPSHTSLFRCTQCPTSHRHSRNTQSKHWKILPPVVASHSMTATPSTSTFVASTSLRNTWKPRTSGRCITPMDWIAGLSLSPALLTCSRHSVHLLVPVLAVFNSNRNRNNGSDYEATIALLTMMLGFPLGLPLILLIILLLKRFLPLVRPLDRHRSLRAHLLAFAGLTSNTASSSSRGSLSRALNKPHAPTLASSARSSLRRRLVCQRTNPRCLRNLRKIRFLKT